MYNSVHCSLDIDECAVSSPCKNGGTCSNIPGSYKCTCDAKYTGRNCETGMKKLDQLGKCLYACPGKKICLYCYLK